MCVWTFVSFCFVLLFFILFFYVLLLILIFTFFVEFDLFLDLRFFFDFDFASSSFPLYFVHPLALFHTFLPSFPFSSFFLFFFFFCMRVNHNENLHFGVCVFYLVEYSITCHSSLCSCAV